MRYTLPALADLDEILGYVAARSPRGARKVQGRIRTVIDLLLQYPYIGAPTADPNIRRATTPPYPYLIFYEVDGEEVVIHAHPPRRTRSVRHAGIELKRHAGR